MFTDKMKLEIMKQVHDPESKKTMQQLAAEYGISPTTIGRWKKQFYLHGEGGLSKTSKIKVAEQRIAQLEKENLSLKEEIELLRKMAILFSNKIVEE